MKSFTSKDDLYYLVDQPAKIAREMNAHINLLQKAMAGDMEFVISPATVDRSATSEDFTREVVVSLKTAGGLTHEWFDGDITIAIAESTAGDGSASIDSTTLSLVNGTATVEISGTGAWAEGDTNTLTVALKKILGYDVASVTSVETIVA